LTGETVTAIADEFQIARQTVPVVFRRIEKKSPSSQQRGGAVLTHRDREQDTQL
jgi:predicted transcriptional regulator